MTPRLPTAVSKEQCAPYLSVSLYKVSGGTGVAPEALLAAIRDTAKESAEKAHLTFPDPQETAVEVDGTTMTWARYVDERPPSWLVDGDLRDLVNHLIVVARRETLFALAFSDNGLRSAITKKIARASAGPLSSISRLTPTEINKAFVEGRVRTLWLTGTHRRTAIKPDSKILSGLELESSLDPLGDQSYFFSSVRSTVKLSDQLASTVVGASPSAGRIWTGPSRTWDEFTTGLNLVLRRATDYMDDTSRSETPIPIVASPLTSLVNVERAYDVAIIVPEQIHDGAPDAAKDESRWLQQFGDTARFEVTAAGGGPNFEAAVYWGDTKIGRLSYEFDQGPRGDVRAKITIVKEPSNKDAESEVSKGQKAEILKICRDADNITVYFDTGHTFSRGHIYETRFRDARFEDWEWIPMWPDDTKYWQEKPLDGKRFAVENTGNGIDKSLFGLIARHWPNLNARGPQTGWLVCDDGAGESADFIHIDDTVKPAQLTLIHAKGSGSDKDGRDISVSDYEVVVGQAVKNLRHVDRGLLLAKLKANANGALKDAVWHNGKRLNNRDSLLAMLAKQGSNLETKVVVLQPRVRKTVLENIREKMDKGNKTSAAVRRVQQLDALLLAARANCFSLGAKFVVIADADRKRGSTPPVSRKRR